MKPALLAVSLLAGLLNGSTSVSSDTEYPATTTPALIELQQSTTTLQDKVAYYAQKHSISQNTLLQVVMCESSGNPNAIGDNGHSFGLVQIFLDYHPTITKENALDPDFALNFLADNISKGKGSLWTCFRNLKLTT